ncbi:hypothetical protein K450DRAFT_221223 [Umbelopsis ramanniana AG]|uniref:F-box domain-containing protein n=1 Tax=Umbelopsis ramanniana AG TaxID=1314678 RepID=A0AAD5HJ75_UMBRA|nr:uncharacterized protein K450DRAFT_221223 [Umbelopsis ramanniana AG]KAI8584043.1 hypothetical protein K450DRAFT_221223 [Umbelopsis ramanniana AG]
MSQLATFPHELLTKIMSHLNNGDILNCVYINRNWNYVACAYFLYRNLRLANTRTLNACLDMMDQTALKRNSPGQQSEYSGRNYGAYVKCVDLSYDGSNMVLDEYKLTRLATHCHNLEILNIRNSHDLRDKWVAEILKRCPHLIHINLSGCGFLTSRCLESTNAVKIRQNLQVLNTIFCYRFWPTSVHMTFPSLTDLKLQVMDMSGFTVVRQLVAACSNSLQSLAIIWRYRLSIESVFASASINQILQNVPKLKRLALDCQTGESLEVYQFPTTLVELQLYCLCAKVTVTAVENLRNLKRLFLNYTFISQSTIQQVLDANGRTLEALGYNEGSGRPLTKALLAPCVNLRSLQTTLAPGPSLINVIADLYRQRLEHLSNKWEGHTYIPSAFKPIEGLWELLTSSPWPRIRSFDIVNAVVTKDILYKLPEAFPNVEYLGFIVSLEQDLSPDEWISYFSLFPNLKGIGLRQDLRIPYHVSEFWNGRYLKKFQSAYQDWSMNEQYSTENICPIRNPFDTWPQTMILHTMSRDSPSSTTIQPLQ